jgi:hypothetical protein
MWGFGGRTKVIVDNKSPWVGRISMTAGGSPAEYNDVERGEVIFERNFGGVLLTVKNESQRAPLEVKTE